VRVVLVNPPYVFWKAKYQFLERALGHTAPLGLLSIAAYARARKPGLELKIVDAPAQCLSVEETVDRVAREAPEVVGITVTTMVMPAAQAIAEAVRRRLPGVVVVAGGPHISHMGERALDEAPGFDYAVIGEGEETFCELLQRLAEGKSLGDVAGLAYRDASGEKRRTEAREPIEDLDELPFPAWDLLPEFPEAYPSNLFFSPKGPCATLCSSRGCTFRCGFCDQSTFGHTFRALSAERVVAAVEHLQERFGIRYVLFCDDNFTLSRARVWEICRGLRALKRPLAWSCDANVMTVDRAMLREMKEAGCWGVSFGIESGSQEILDSVGKNVLLERAREAVEAADEEGVRVKGLFIMGTPEESPETIRATRAFLSTVPLTTMNLSKFTPYPGAELSRAFAGVVADGYERLNGMNFIVPSKHLSIEELERVYAETLRQFFSQKRVRRAHLRILLGQGSSLGRLLGMARQGLRAKWGR